MKTITEFSGILLQRAAEAQRAFRAANPQPTSTETSAPEAPSASPTEGESAAAPDGAAGETGGEAAAPTDESPAESASSESAAVPAEEAVAEDLGAGPEAEAVGAAMGLEGDRLSRMMEALAVAGKRVSSVRLVRVLAFSENEQPPSGVQKQGDFYYAVDLKPRQESRRDSDDRRGRGDRRDDRGGRGRGPGGGGGRGLGGPGGGGGRGPGGPGGGGGRGPGGGGRGGRGEGFSSFGRDDVPRGELARGGEGWMLTRAPEERRERTDPTRRDSGRRPARPGQFDGRGPRAEGAGGGRPGERPRFGARPGDRPQGDRPQGNRPQGDRPQGDRPQGNRPQGDRPQGDRPQGDRPRSDRPRNAAGGRSNHGGGDQRPNRQRDDRHRGPAGGGGRRRGGWDEPAPEPQTTQAAAPSTPDVPPTVSAEPETK